MGIINSNVPVQRKTTKKKSTLSSGKTASKQLCDHNDSHKATATEATSATRRRETTIMAERNQCERAAHGVAKAKMTRQHTYMHSHSYIPTKLCRLQSKFERMLSHIHSTHRLSPILSSSCSLLTLCTRTHVFVSLYFFRSVAATCCWTLLRSDFCSWRSC